MKGNKSRKKLRTKYANYLYGIGLVKGVHPKLVRLYCRTLEKIARDHYSIQARDRGHSMRILSERWFKQLHTGGQKSFKGGRKNHSYYSFASWVDKNYYIIPIERNSGLRYRLAVWLSKMLTPKP